MDQLCEYTIALLTDADLRKRTQVMAYARSQLFTRERFEARVRELYAIIERDYTTIARPDPQELLNPHFRFES